MTTKKKSIAKKTTVIKKTKIKKSGISIAIDQALIDQSLWDTEKGGIPVDHFVTLAYASERINRFNELKKSIPKSAFLQPSNIDKKLFLQLLNNPQVESLRFYFGINSKGKVQVFFVGADKNHSDVYLKRRKSANTAIRQNAKIAAVAGDEEGAIDVAQGCPAYNDNSVMLPL